MVGAGPTAIYTFQALLARAARPGAITIFERQRRAGQGTPYSANWADPIMLANIASIEIPALPQRLVDWLRSETDARLASLGVAREEIDDRAFYPWLALGEYLSAQFSLLVHRARSMGIEIEVRTQTTVSDVRITGDTINGHQFTHGSNQFPFRLLHPRDRPSMALGSRNTPRVLGQHPFAQGITSSAEMAEVVADAIEAAETKDSKTARGEIPSKTMASGSLAGQCA